jgi:hypothetical protein
MGYIFRHQHAQHSCMPHSYQLAHQNHINAQLCVILVAVVLQLERFYIAT